MRKLPTGVGAVTDLAGRVLGTRFIGIALSALGLIVLAHVVPTIGLDPRADMGPASLRKGDTSFDAFVVAAGGRNSHAFGTNQHR